MRTIPLMSLIALIFADRFGLKRRKHSRGRLCHMGMEEPELQRRAYTQQGSVLAQKILLTKKFVNAKMLHMLDVEVIADPTAAAVALEPVRSRLLAELAEPASAATLAGRLGIARQKINYHLRT